LLFLGGSLESEKFKHFELFFRVFLLKVVKFGVLLIMMERAESGQKLYTRMRLWEFPDQYVIEPTDGSCGSSLAVNKADGSMNLIGLLLYLLSFVEFDCKVFVFRLIDLVVFGIFGM
jgi:hypothetical protein